jgi:hypothetical protein
MPQAWQGIDDPSLRFGDLKDILNQGAKRKKPRNTLRGFL